MALSSLTIFLSIVITAAAIAASIVSLRRHLMPYDLAHPHILTAIAIIAYVY